MTTRAARPANEEIFRLLRAYRERGDRRAIERILALHGKLLNHIVRRYASSSGESREDLLQVGYMGLMKAVNGYDAASGAKFCTYAHAMMEGEIRHHLRDAELVKRPRWARSLYSRVAGATSTLTAQLGRPPLVEEVAAQVNISPEGVMELMKLFHDTDVLSLEGGEDGQGADLSAIRSIHYETFSLPVEDRIVLEQALESLTEIQRKVVYLFFYKDLSQTEIGQRLSLPQRKISRVIASAVKSLKDSHYGGGGSLEERS